MNFVKLTSTNGRPVYVNPQHIIAVYENKTRTNTSVLTSQSTPEGVPYILSIQDSMQAVVEAVEALQEKRQNSFLI